MALIGFFKQVNFAELMESRPVTFNNTGNFQCADKYEDGFVMTGNVTVVNQNNDSTTAGLYDTVDALMVPSPFFQNVVESMRSAGCGIDSIHTSIDLWGGQEDTRR